MWIISKCVTISGLLRLASQTPSTKYPLYHPRASGVAAALLCHWDIPLKNTSANEIAHEEYGRPRVMWYDIWGDFSHTLLILHAKIRMSVTGRVGSVTTSAVKSLDASAKSLDASAKYFGRIGEIFRTHQRNFWMRRRNMKSLDASAKYFWLIGGVLVAWAAQHWSPRQG